MCCPYKKENNIYKEKEIGLGMETDTLKERIARWRNLADVFIKHNIPAFIREENGDIHFCNLVLNGEDAITIDNFGPEQRKGKREMLFWMLITEFDKYEEKWA